MLRTIFYPVLLFLLAGCSNPKVVPDISFYYWRSAFELNTQEKICLRENNCRRLFVKYFDVVKEDGMVRPIASITFKQLPPTLNIIPVIFIKNDVFKETDSIQVERLAKNALSLIDQINFANAITMNEIQLDCDWTEHTKNNFFRFIRRMKLYSKKPIGVTIRLHQAKYKNISGIPPADKGVLMYYNMGEINGSYKNSIYDKNTANKYLNALKTYPLQLDIALPIFTWGIQLRDKEVVGLLNKMNENYFNTDTNFVPHEKYNFRVKNAGFKEGYYFQKGDEIKIEFVKQEDLLEMADAVRVNLSASPANIIFYDLDSLNLSRYDSRIFKKILDKFK